MTYRILVEVENHIDAFLFRESFLKFYKHDTYQLSITYFTTKREARNSQPTFLKIINFFRKLEENVYTNHKTKEDDGDQADISTLTYIDRESLQAIGNEGIRFDFYISFVNGESINQNNYNVANTLLITSIDSIKNVNDLSFFSSIQKQSHIKLVLSLQNFESNVKNMLLELPMKKIMILNKVLIIQVYAYAILAEIGILPTDAKANKTNFIWEVKERHNILFSEIWRYFFLTVSRLFRKLRNKMRFFPDYAWKVYYSFDGLHGRVYEWNKLKGRNRYYADPFLIHWNQKDLLFVEEIHKKNRVGIIAIFERTENEFQRVGQVDIELDHVSFPCVFVYEEQLFICPESSKNMELAIYKCLDFPNKWEISSRIFFNRRFIDPLIFQKENKWWLWVSEDILGGGSISHSYLYYSENPLKGEWHPHKLNPVYSLSSLAQNGGLIMDDENFYRVVQKRSTERYGAGIFINALTSLSIDEFEEIETDAFLHFSDLKSTHHLTSLNEIVVIDSQSFRFKSKSKR